MIKRFEGPDGRRRLAEALEDFKLVKQNKALAKSLADVGDVVTFKKDQSLMLEGDADNDAFFILAGEAEVLIKKNRMGIRKAGEVVGELAILDTAEPRSATIKAISDVTALKVSEPDFSRLADEYPQIWKSVASTTAHRLRQRSNLLNTPNDEPIMFIGCSAESLEIAQEIQLGLEHDVHVVLWTNGVFTASDVVIDKLLTAVNESDFALFVFAPDDEVVSRGVSYSAPRDNTIFELGLFMGRLDRDRTFILQQRGAKVKIPSDLLGVVDLQYTIRKSGDLGTSLAPVCTQLRKIVKARGTRSL